MARPENADNLMVQIKNANISLDKVQVGLVKYVSIVCSGFPSADTHINTRHNVSMAWICTE